MSASIDTSKLIAGLAQAHARVRAAALRAVDQFANQVIGDSQQLCPVDTGALQASGTALPAEFDGNTVTATIGHNVVYAAAVHERMTRGPRKPRATRDKKGKFRKQGRVGQPKFLETAIRANAPKFMPFVADAIRKAL